MRKPISLLFMCLRSVLTKDQFEALMDHFSVEKFQLRPEQRYLYVDEKRLLLTEEYKGIILYVIRDSDYQFLMLRSAKGEMWKDVLFDEEYDSLIEDGILPAPGHSNVVRQLRNMGIEGDVELLEDFTEESAHLQINLPDGVNDSVKICLERTRFPGEELQHELVIWYKEEKDKDRAEYLLKTILSEHSINREEPVDHIQKFYELVTQRV
jgi:uncharacterized protein YjbK